MMHFTRCSSVLHWSSHHTRSILEAGVFYFEILSVVSVCILRSEVIFRDAVQNATSETHRSAPGGSRSWSWMRAVSRAFHGVTQTALSTQYCKLCFRFPLASVPWNTCSVYGPTGLTPNRENARGAAGSHFSSDAGAEAYPANSH